jgi:hypothetical protein
VTDQHTISSYDAEMLANTNPQMSSGNWTYVTTQDLGSRRWHSDHMLVVRHDDGSFWGLTYSVGLTEYQEHDYPWGDGDADAQIELTRLFPREYTAVEYLDRKAFLRKTGEAA